MIALRMLSLLAGLLVLILPATLLADDGVPSLSVTTAIAAMAGMALVSASFVYIGMAGDRMRRNGRARALGGALLAVPIVGSLGLLASHKEANLLCASGALLSFSLVLFLSFIFPATEHRQRPMRRRERQEPSLLKLPG
ncbi:MAG TPA: hypothetical protein VF793_16240 [Telluria sp.]|jgi:hypothetical protein